MVDNNGATGQVTSNYTYDADGNLLSSSDDNARTIAYTYDVAAEATCITYPVIASPNCANAPSSTNSVVDRTYDGDGRLATTKDWFGHTITYSNYNQNSQLGKISYPTTTAESLSYGYDPTGNLTSANYAGPTAGTNSWTYNADEQEATTNQLGTFTSPTDSYNSYKQVSTASNPTGTGSIADTYTNAANGEVQVDQPTGQSAIDYYYNSGAQLTSVYNLNNPPATDDATFSYTADGQRCATYFESGTYKPNNCAAPPVGSSTDQWNAYGELCWSKGAYSLPSCSSPQAGATKYTYNGDGLRMSESPSTGFQFKFSWDNVDGGSTPLMMDDGDYAYIYGPTLFGGTAPVEQIHLSTNVVTYLTVIPSGVQDVLSTAGAMKEQSAYSTYGNQVVEGGTAGTTFIGFQGSFTDPSGLLYLVNRYYDPSTDQFLSVDPAVATTGQPYAFTGDNPLNATDPLGLYSCGDRSPSSVVRYLKRGKSTFTLRCGRSRSGRTPGYGIRHIQQDGRHFGGNVSGIALGLIANTVARGKPMDPGPTSIAYVKEFVAKSTPFPGSSLDGGGLPEPEVFTVRVVVDIPRNDVTTAKVDESIVDQNPLDHCNFGGDPVCGLSFSSP